ncbi:hypothetical protein N7494_011318 [Penicillium frequentans]|uniref:Uncharacterized protein n=1 Tax=Penicillium frequentans TaxID=3151616 RepID=A0AAD6CJF1_9EURO|nr:hypothetical protein N7494_011318 [Penicillium glabrum]
MSEQEEQGDAESDSLLGQLRKEVSAKARGIKGIINVLLVFSVSLNILILGVGFGYKRPQSYEYGFDSDLELTQYHFTGGVKFTENGDFDMEQTTPKYTGSPSREIDEAWAHLLSVKNRLRQALYPNYYNVFSNPNDPPREHHIVPRRPHPDGMDFDWRQTHLKDRHYAQL